MTKNDLNVAKKNANVERKTPTVNAIRNHVMMSLESLMKLERKKDQRKTDRQLQKRRPRKQNKTQP